MRTGGGVLLSALVLLTAGAAVAAVAAAPGAITGPVSAVGATNATASGTVNPGGVSTNWFFEYGTSTSYGRRTTTRNAGAGTANVGVSAALTGLAPGTTYHYRLVATNGDGTTRGADGIFTTTSTPAATTGAVSRVTTTSARLAGSVDPNGRATTWFFEYGTTTGYGARTAAVSAGSGNTARSVSADVTGLTPGDSSTTGWSRRATRERAGAPTARSPPQGHRSRAPARRWTSARAAHARPERSTHRGGARPGTSNTARRPATGRGPRAVAPAPASATGQ